jgi:hypothetical protein
MDFLERGRWHELRCRERSIHQCVRRTVGLSKVQTCKWPEKSVFALELRKPATEGSINKGGQYQTDFIAVEFSVKDTPRLPDGWGYFGFNGSTSTAKVLGTAAGCNACHSKNAAVEHTFVQFYPTLLPIAQSKGTLSAAYVKESAAAQK